MNRSLLDCISLVIDKRGVTPKKLKADWSDSGYRVLSANNVKTGCLQNLEEIRHIDELTYRKWMTQEIQKGDILLTSEAPAGEVFYWDSNEKIVAGQRIFILRPSKDIYPQYLYYCLQTIEAKKEIAHKCSGSTVFGISAEMFRHIVLNINESYDEQKKIGDFIYSIEKKINNNKKQIKALESIAKTIYDYWFVQFDFPNEEGKPYKSSGGKMVWNEMLKINIPQGWNVCTLEDKVEFEKGISYSSDSISTNDGTPMINLANIDINKNYKKDGLKFFNEKVDESKLVIGGDLLIACTDLTKKADIIGCPVTVPYDSLKYVYSTDIAKLNVTTDLIDPLFLYMTLRTDFYHSYIKRWASGTNVIHLNLDGIKLYPVCIPDMKLQKRFSKIEELILRYVSKLHLINTELEKLRELLLPMLMNGQASLI